MPPYEKQPHTRVKRAANRAAYDEKTVHEIIDDAYVAHVGFMMDNRPFVIPMFHAREKRTLYIHASVKSRIYKTLAEGIPVCITFTHIDGLVLARSAFHHSMNYRSVVAHGFCVSVKDEAKKRAFEILTNKVALGRWDECRPITQKEMDVTGLLAFTIEAAAAKIRTGGPKDDQDDYALPIWAGVIPLERKMGVIIPDSAMTQDLDLPDSVKRIVD